MKLYVSRCVGVLCAASLTVAIAGCGPAPRPHAPSSTAVPFLGEMISALEMGEARIAVGMTKDEVLEQIALSRSQYESVHASTAELIGVVPDDAIVRRHRWLVTCVTRNAHLLGGGSGLHLDLVFVDGRVSSMRRLPWVAG